MATDLAPRIAPLVRIQDFPLLACNGPDSRAPT
jgi:hypothetical protein